MSYTYHDGKVGFYNQGNSCFLNAACQCILRLPEVQYLLLTNYSNPSRDNHANVSIVSSLAYILAEMYQTSHSAVSLEKLYPAIDSVASYICDGAQHDSHEVLSFLLQGMEEELNKGNNPDSPMKNSFSVEDVEPAETKEEWWNEYIKYHNDDITQLFYGYSIDTYACPKCDFSTFTLSTYNTIHVCLPLTHYKIHVNLVYQYMNAESGDISLTVRCIRVKVPESATIRDVFDYINNRLKGTNCSIYSIIANYDNQTKHINYSPANPATPVSELFPTLKKKHILLSYIVSIMNQHDLKIPYSQINSHHLLLHSTILEKNGVPEVEMVYQGVPFLVCFDQYSHDEYVTRTNYILFHIQNGNFRDKTDFTTDVSLVPDFYLHNNVFFEDSRVCCSISTSFIETLKIYESVNKLFPKVINRTTMECDMKVDSVHYSIIVDWSPSSSYYDTPQIAKALSSFDLNLIPVSLSQGVADGFDILQGLSQEVTSDNSFIRRCDGCHEQIKCSHTNQYGVFPPLLVIQLKRFDCCRIKKLVQRNGVWKEEKRYVKQKITDRVEFPLRGFNLSSYSLEKDDSVYDLYSVCNHHGTPNKGHYYSYCYDERSEKWFEYNDERVRPISEEEVVTSNAYLLFYRKRQPLIIEMNNIRQLALNVPIELPTSNIHTPSKWLDEDLNDDEAKDTVSTNKNTVVPFKFTAYVPPTMVGRVNTDETIVDIQGQKVKATVKRSDLLKEFKKFIKHGTTRDVLIGDEPSTSPIRGGPKSTIQERNRNTWDCIQGYSCFLLLLCVSLIIIVIMIMQLCVCLYSDS